MVGWVRGLGVVPAPRAAHHRSDRLVVVVVVGVVVVERFVWGGVAVDCG